jgi:hypothetical protein
LACPRRRPQFADEPSIKKIGLLHPITVTPEQGTFRLITGYRRLKAFELLGWKKIPCRIAEKFDDAVLALTAERDENTCRQDLAPSEKVALGRALEEIEKPAAKERRKRRKISSGKLPEQIKGRSRDLIAKTIGGISGKTYEKAKAVVDAGKPEVVEEMDRTGKVDPAYQKINGKAASTRIKLRPIINRETLDQHFDEIYRDLPDRLHQWQHMPARGMAENLRQAARTKPRSNRRGQE